MSLKTHALSQLDGLSPFASGPAYMVSARDAGVTLACDLIGLDRIGVAFEQMTLRHDSLIGAATDRLRTIADAAARRLTYLLESVATVEVDAQQCTVMLRSDPPSRDGRVISYYELLVRQDGSLILQRFEAISGQPGRSQIACEVTREVFGRLIDDLATLS